MTDNIEEECADCEIHYSDEESTVELTDTVNSSKRNRFKSWALWLAIAGLVSVVLTTFGVWDKIGISSNAFDNIVTAVGSVLTAFGVLNNPTNGGGF